MYKRIHDRFGAAGVVIGVIALVAALGGTAYAAKGAFTSSQKKEIEKIAKKVAGAPGAVGPQGPAGSGGKDGANGTNGSAGGPGVSPAGINFSGSKMVGSVTCTEGGTEYKGATTNLVCNGKKGVEGSPWTAGGTLPSGKTETGSWSARSETPTALSFQIPLAAEVAEDHTRYVGAGGHEWSIFTETELTTVEEEAIPNSAHFKCKGNPAAPKAEPGFLCVYAASENEVIGASELSFTKPSSTSQSGASVSGSLLHLFPTGATNPNGYGTWAVTAS